MGDERPRPTRMESEVRERCSTGRAMRIVEEKRWFVARRVGRQAVGVDDGRERTRGRHKGGPAFGKRNAPAEKRPVADGEGRTARSRTLGTARATTRTRMEKSWPCRAVNVESLSGVKVARRGGVVVAMRNDVHVLRGWTEWIQGARPRALGPVLGWIGSWRWTVRAAGMEGLQQADTMGP